MIDKQGSFGAAVVMDRRAPFLMSTAWTAIPVFLPAFALRLPMMRSVRKVSSGQCPTTPFAGFSARKTSVHADQ
jgi:hypothetical protein